MKKIMSLLLIGFVLAPGLSFAQVADIDPISQDTECITIVNNLRYKDRDINKNGEVSTLQDFLQARNYLNNEPTGYFGLMTQKAVKSFQNANGISPSGYVGPITREKIKNLTCNEIIPIPKEQKLSGYLYSQGLTTTMWGTHTLSVDTGVRCITTPCPSALSYLVSANSSSVLADLKYYENSRVIISGQASWISLEGGFWGIVATKVTPLSEVANKPVISGVSGPQSLNVNQTGTWTVNAYNPNGLSLTYSVNWGDENNLDVRSASQPKQAVKQSQSATFTHSYGEAGTYVPVFTVTGDSGIRCITYPCPSSESASTSLSVNVLPNYWY